MVSEFWVAFGARPLEQLGERLDKLLDQLGAARRRGIARRADQWEWERYLTFY